MKEKVYRSVAFIIIIIVADFLIGNLLKQMYFITDSEDIAKIRYTLDSTSQDILIYGSSRAQHHYIPDTIEKSTGKSCYNCGFGGQGLGFSLIQINEMLKRHKPELIILDH